MSLSKEQIHGFSGAVLSSRYDNPRPTPDCHLEWWDACCSEHKFVAIAAPRGHAKSTAITHAYILAAALFKERKFVLLVSDTWGQAVMFLQDIKTELLENDMLIELFGEMTFEKEAEDDIIVRMQDGDKFRIMAKGSEQKVRGLKWNGRRPDLIVGDDLENDEIVMNPERRKKFKEWFTGALLPARSSNGIVRIVGTILHTDSLLENFMPKRSDRKYTKESDLKMWSAKTDRSWYAIKYKAHNPDFSQILWPGQWTKQKLLFEKQNLINLGVPEKYSQEYLNEPIDEAFAFFRRGDLRGMNDEEREEFALGRMVTYMACDFAVSQAERADYTVLMVGAVDQYNQLHIIDVLKDRMDAKQIIDNMIAFNDRYSPELVTVEKGQIEKALGPFLRSQMMEQDSFLNLNLVTPTKDKESRARSIQGRMRAGGVKFDKDAEWYPELEQELLSFPRAVHDDQVDALAWLGLTVHKMQQAPTEEEIEDEEYQHMLIDSGHFEEGRNVHTGY